jgi:hypothetical protein
MDAAKYQTLSDEQRARIAAVLAQREALEAAAAGPGELDTEAVEEFMSISDGQVRGGRVWLMVLSVIELVFITFE